MGIFKNIIRDLFSNHKYIAQPWVEYYDENDKKIKFTTQGIYEYLRSSIGKDKNLIALNYFGNKITYGDMFHQIEIVSRSLHSYGVREKDIVTICMPNTPEAVISFYACNNIGAIANMIHPLSAQEQIKGYLLEAKSRILIMIDIDYEKIKDIIKDTLIYKVILVSASNSMPFLTKVGYQVTRGIKIRKPSFRNSNYVKWNEFVLRGISYQQPYKKEVKAHDVALILHSGGTTGVSKGIMLSNYNFNAEAQQGAINVKNVRPKDKILTILPVFHGFGLDVCVHCPLCLKVETILIPEFNAKKFHHLLKKNKPNVIAGVPTLWEAMLNNSGFKNVDLSYLKYMISGGDYLTVSLEEKVNEFLSDHGAKIKIGKGYGMTESVAATAFTMEGANIPGSIGIPMIGNQYMICNPGGIEELPFGKEGEICVLGPTIMKGYLNNKEETSLVLKEHQDHNIWLHTGDMGYIDHNGIIYFTGRIKRMIISSGFNVYPAQIEEVIERHPSVLKCCVIGIPHLYKVEVAKAFIVLKDLQKPTFRIKKEIKELCEQNLAKYSIPKEYEFRDFLPKTLYNKIDYKLLEREEKDHYEKRKK